MESLSHINIADPLVIAVPIKDSEEKLQSVRGLIDLGPPPESSVTKEHYHLLRESVVKKLLRAQSHLPNGLKFRLYEAIVALNFRVSCLNSRRLAKYL